MGDQSLYKGDYVQTGKKKEFIEGTYLFPQTLLYIDICYKRHIT